MTPSVCTMAGGVLIYTAPCSNIFLSVRVSLTPSLGGLFGKQPVRLCKKSAGCFVFGWLLANFKISLYGLTSVNSEKNDTRWLFHRLSGGVFAYQSSYPHDDALQNGLRKPSPCPLLRYGD